MKKDNLGSLISLGKLKQKFAKLTHNDILYVEGANNIIDGFQLTEHDIDITKDRLHKIMNKYSGD